LKYIASTSEPSKSPVIEAADEAAAEQPEVADVPAPEAAAAALMLRARETALWRAQGMRAAAALLSSLRTVDALQEAASTALCLLAAAGPVVSARKRRQERRRRRQQNKRAPQPSASAAAAAAAVAVASAKSEFAGVPQNDAGAAAAGVIDGCGQAEGNPLPGDSDSSEDGSNADQDSEEDGDDDDDHEYGIVVATADGSGDTAEDREALQEGEGDAQEENALQEATGVALAPSGKVNPSKGDGSSRATARDTKGRNSDSCSDGTDGGGESGADDGSDAGGPSAGVILQHPLRSQDVRFADSYALDQLLSAFYVLVAAVAEVLNRTCGSGSGGNVSAEITGGSSKCALQLTLMRCLDITFGASDHDFLHGAHIFGVVRDLMAVAGRADVGDAKVCVFSDKQVPARAPGDGTPWIRLCCSSPPKRKPNRQAPVPGAGPAPPPFGADPAMNPFGAPAYYYAGAPAYAGAPGPFGLPAAAAVAAPAEPAAAAEEGGDGGAKHEEEVEAMHRKLLPLIGGGTDEPWQSGQPVPPDHDRHMRPPGIIALPVATIQPTIDI
jgi:hypothetical protein